MLERAPRQERERPIKPRSYSLKQLQETVATQREGSHDAKMLLQKTRYVLHAVPRHIAPEGSGHLQLDWLKHAEPPFGFDLDPEQTIDKREGVATLYDCHGLPVGSFPLAMLHHILTRGMGIMFQNPEDIAFKTETKPLWFESPLAALTFSKTLQQNKEKSFFHTCEEFVKSAKRLGLGRTLRGRQLTVINVYNKLQGLCGIRKISSPEGRAAVLEFLAEQTEGAYAELPKEKIDKITAAVVELVQESSFTKEKPGRKSAGKRRQEQIHQNRIKRAQDAEAPERDSMAWMAKSLAAQIEEQRTLSKKNISNFSLGSVSFGRSYIREHEAMIETAFVVVNEMFDRELVFADEFKKYAKKVWLDTKKAFANGNAEKINSALRVQLYSKDTSMYSGGAKNTILADTVIL